MLKCPQMQLIYAVSVPKTPSVKAGLEAATALNSQAQIPAVRGVIIVHKGDAFSRQSSSCKVADGYQGLVSHIVR
ncbi:MAG: hypothetical protein F6K31_34255 [Symploca sp. SIO2G7]|nr:hypothetical protein [Symploca sp. SIO2G7]